MIGERIRKYRQINKIKVVDFSKLIGISQGSLSDIENHKTKPSAETISALVRNTDIDAKWLLTGEGDIFDKDLDSIENNSKTDLKHSPEMQEAINLLLKLDKKRFRQVLAVIYKARSEQMIEEEIK